MASAPVPITRSRCVIASARMRNTPSDSSWGRIVNSDPGLCCGPVNSVRQGVDVRCVPRPSPAKVGRTHLCVTGVHMASTGSARGGGRISILYSFPHAFGAPGIGWTAWNQVERARPRRPRRAPGRREHLASRGRASPRSTTSLAVAGRRVPHRVMGRDRALAWHDRRRRPGGAPAPLGAGRWCTCGRSPRPARSRRRAVAASRRSGRCRTPTPRTPTRSSRASPRGSASRRAPARRTPPIRDGSPRRSGSGRPRRRSSCPSDAVAATFLERGFDEARLRRHRYGCTPAAPVVRRADGRPGLTAVFLGRVEPRKGLHHALDAWIASTASDEGRLLVFGAVDDDYRAAARRSPRAPERRAARGDADRRSTSWRAPTCCCCRASRRAARS